MRSLFLMLVCLLLIGCVSYPPVPQTSKQSHIIETIHSGDELRLMILDEDDLSGVYKVDALGAITLPLVGPVNVSGLTLEQSATAISHKLKKGFLKNAQIAVSFQKQRDIYVLGEVQRPGNYPYTPDLTIVNAIAQAGGYTYRASKRAMLLRRQDKNGVTHKYNANEDSLLQPGDSITVQERFF